MSISAWLSVQGQDSAQALWGRASACGRHWKKASAKERGGCSVPLVACAEQGGGPGHLSPPASVPSHCQPWMLSPGLPWAEFGYGPAPSFCGAQGLYPAMGSPARPLCWPRAWQSPGQGCQCRPTGATSRCADHQRHLSLVCPLLSSVPPVLYSKWVLGVGIQNVRNCQNFGSVIQNLELKSVK